MTTVDNAFGSALPAEFPSILAYGSDILGVIGTVIERDNDSDLHYDHSVGRSAYFGKWLAMVKKELRRFVLHCVETFWDVQLVEKLASVELYLNLVLTSMASIGRRITDQYSGQ